MNRKTKIADKKKQVLFSELYSLLTSGLSFSRSFELLIRSEKKEKDIQLLNRIYQDILGGEEFWKSLENSEAFEKLDSGVIRIGEETGKLDQSLVFLGDYYRKKIEQRRIAHQCAELSCCYIAHCGSGPDFYDDRCCSDV
ncbi:MAG: type II secretion system F family protein [Mangrovibacterium sp.]